MSEIIQVSCKVDVTRDKYNGRWASMNISKPPNCLTQLFIRGIFARGCNMNQVYLKFKRCTKYITCKMPLSSSHILKHHGRVSISGLKFNSGSSFFQLFCIDIDKMWDFMTRT
jgi:hypothetical protein